MIPCGEILLVYVDSVDPYHRSFCARLEAGEGLPEVVSNLEKLPVEEDRMIQVCCKRHV